MENKIEIQNKVIDELKANLKEAEDSVKTGAIDDMENLLSEIRQIIYLFKIHTVYKY